MKASIGALGAGNEHRSDRRVVPMADAIDPYDDRLPVRRRSSHASFERSHPDILRSFTRPFKLCCNSMDGCAVCAGVLTLACNAVLFDELGCGVERMHA
jgi:hypothetical protein